MIDDTDTVIFVLSNLFVVLCDAIFEEWIKCRGFEYGERTRCENKQSYWEDLVEFQEPIQAPS